MKRVAFKMKLSEGCKEEYESRHTEIWDELKALLKQSGIRDYSIFLEETTNDLFGFLTIDDTKKLDESSHEPVMQKWWAYMKDIMQTNEDNSPLSISLKEVFYLP